MTPPIQLTHRYRSKYHKYRKKYTQQRAGVNLGYDPETQETFVGIFNHRGPASSHPEFGHLPPPNLSRGFWVHHPPESPAQLELYRGTASTDTTKPGHFWTSNPWVALQFTLGFPTGDQVLSQEHLVQMVCQTQSLAQPVTDRAITDSRCPPPKLQRQTTINPGDIFQNATLLVGKFHDFRPAPTTLTSYQVMTSRGRETFNYLTQLCPTPESVIIVPFNQDQLVLCDPNQWLSEPPARLELTYQDILDTILSHHSNYQPPLLRTPPRPHPQLTEVLRQIEPDVSRWELGLFHPNQWMEQQIRRANRR